MAAVTRERLIAAARRHGPASFARAAGTHLVRLGFVDEHHVWYVLDLNDTVSLPLAEGYELRRVSAGDELESRLLDLRPEVATGRLADGNDLWVAECDGDPAFNSFVFFGRTPVRAAASRFLELPPGTACLEDSVTAAEHRGRGIASAAWSLIARELRDRGFSVLISKVAVDNAPSRRAIEKVGFVGAAVMHLRRRGLAEHVDIKPEATKLTPAGAAAAEALARSLSR